MAFVPVPRTEYSPPSDLRSEVVQPWAIRQIVSMALLSIAAAGDFANFYITMSGLANEHPLITVLVVLALTAAAVALAHAVGLLLRERQQSHRSTAPTVLILMSGGWLFLGVSAAIVRWVVPYDDGSAGAAAQFGDQTATSDDTVHRITSLLLLGLYLASGVLAAWLAYRDHEPVLAARRMTWRRLVWTGGRNRWNQAKLVRAETRLQQHLDERARLAANHAAALADREALAAELKEYTRVLIAGHLGEPVATQGLTSQQSPRSSHPADQ